MDSDKRKAPRRPMRYTAWIALPNKKFHGCALADISESGARIDIDDSTIVPDRFPLFLSGNGKARRVCTVVWRKPRQLGVKFSTRLAPGDHANLVPHTESAPPLAPAVDEPTSAESH